MFTLGVCDFQNSLSEKNIYDRWCWGTSHFDNKKWQSKESQNKVLSLWYCARSIHTVPFLGPGPSLPVSFVLLAIVLVLMASVRNIKTNADACNLHDCLWSSTTEWEISLCFWTWSFPRWPEVRQTQVQRGQQGKCHSPLKRMILQKKSRQPQCPYLGEKKMVTDVNSLTL